MGPGFESQRDHWKPLEKSGGFFIFGFSGKVAVAGMRSLSRCSEANIGKSQRDHNEKLLSTQELFLCEKATTSSQVSWYHEGPSARKKRMNNPSRITMKSGSSGKVAELI